MEKKFQDKLEELKKLQDAGTLEENQKGEFEMLTQLAATEKTVEEKSKLAETALAQKEHFRTKFEELEKKPKENQGGAPAASNIDPLEITRLGKQLAQYNDQETDLIIDMAKGKFGTSTPSPAQIMEASKDQWIQIAINANREKVEKEQALLPSNKQPDTKKPMNLEQSLENASLEEAEKILTEKGLYREPRRRHERVVLKEGVNR
jgi:hypothetical protein